jgi:ligand-binding SRPBCC domain-containing protein
MRWQGFYYVDKQVPRLIFESLIPCSVEELWEFHSNAKVLEVLTPKNRKAEMIGDDLEVRDGAVHKIRLRQFGVWIEWHALISEVEPLHQFVDTATKSPFKCWVHRHQMQRAEGGTMLIDTVDYNMPFGFIGKVVDLLVVQKDIKRLFAFRHQQTLNYFRKP